MVPPRPLTIFLFLFLVLLKHLLNEFLLLLLLFSKLLTPELLFLFTFSEILLTIPWSVLNFAGIYTVFPLKSLWALSFGSYAVLDTPSHLFPASSLAVTSNFYTKPVTSTFQNPAKLPGSCPIFSRYLDG